MQEIRKIKRKNLDVEKYSKALNDSLNYRIYAEVWYLDVLTDGNWECWIYGDYEVIMPVPFQLKFGIKFIIMPIYCQQLGVFYKEEIPDELFQKFERKIYKSLVRSYAFNEENTERFQPRGEKRVNYILDLNRPYEEIFENYRKDRKRNIMRVGKSEFSLDEAENLESYFELSKKHYPEIYKYIKGSKMLFSKLFDKENLIQYSISVGREINNHRLFLISKNRIYLIASCRNKTKKTDFSSFLIDWLIQKFSNKNLILDFEGSMIPGVALFNESFGGQKRFYTSYCNMQYLNKLK